MKYSGKNIPTPSHRQYTKRLLEKVESVIKRMRWAEQFTSISILEFNTIMHARRSLLFDNTGKAWVKKETANEFDVTMGAFDGAEIAELVGLYTFYTLQKELKYILHLIYHFKPVTLWVRHMTRVVIMLTK